MGPIWYQHHLHFSIVQLIYPARNVYHRSFPVIGVLKLIVVRMTPLKTVAMIF